MGLGGRSWDDWINEYSQGHQNKWNQLTHKFGIPMITLSLLLIIPSFFIEGLWKLALGLFIFGWILQFVGHAIERKPPEFFKDWRFLLVGLRWWFVKMKGR
ncbi:MAG: DUF962 domain-containing protein [Acidobacteria bacterium]|jgi:uncharacterized membrane protein YGL010W|nr:MAG: DUF962 domain-containing protein [Acidobacteriota bacterium]GIU82040.1 MAG: hypothetical protein KatS3mg006_1104 [Pyrinomonadaceae bacterium]